MQHMNTESSRRRHALRTVASSFLVGFALGGPAMLLVHFRQGDIPGSVTTVLFLCLIMGVGSAMHTWVFSKGGRNTPLKTAAYVALVGIAFNVIRALIKLYNGESTSGEVAVHGMALWLITAVCSGLGVWLSRRLVSPQ